MSDLSMSMFASKEDFSAAVAAQQAAKTVVHYESAKFIDWGHGKRAVVVPVDHPSPLVVNGREAITSGVLGYDEATGCFETVNCVYIPAGAKVVDTDDES